MYNVEELNWLGLECGEHLVLCWGEWQWSGLEFVVDV